MLEHLRVLDLTDERGLLCGRMLADMGADVVQVEPLAGSSARAMPPVVAGEGSRSMYWEAFAANKRGVAFDLDDSVDLEVVRRLAAAADVVVTSSSRAWLEARRLDPVALRELDPRLVAVSVTAFGLDGPKAGYVDTDLIVWAAGGPLDPHREEERPPVRISTPQAYLHAGADAAAGALVAVLARRRLGHGQVVEVSAQASIGVATLARSLADAVGDADPSFQKMPVGRNDQSGSGAATPSRMKKWHVRDGLVELHLSMGPAAGAFTNRLFGWMVAEGADAAEFAGWDWRAMPTLMAEGVVDMDDITRARSAVAAFLLPRSKMDVLEAAMEHRLLCMGIFDVADVAASPHLAARGFFTELDVDGHQIRLPGRFAHIAGRSAPSLRRRAPRTGEHQREVLDAWLAPAAEPATAEPVGMLS
jgi:crotonobetainyl-CoA:carnitine CoA-transferase CaiB-like acyl-CoA transferase